MRVLIVIFNLVVLGSVGDLDYRISVVEDRFEGFTKTYMARNLIPNEPGLQITLEDIVVTGLGAMVLEYEHETSYHIFAEISDEDWHLLRKNNV